MCVCVCLCVYVCVCARVCVCACVRACAHAANLTLSRYIIPPKGTTFFICVSRPAHALISESGEKKRTKKIQRKCVGLALDKFAWTSTGEVR